MSVDGQSEEPGGPVGGPGELAPVDRAAIRPAGAPPPPEAPQTTQQDRQRAEQGAAPHSASMQRWNLSVALAVVVLIAVIVVGVVLLAFGHSSGVNPRTALGLDTSGTGSLSGTTTNPTPNEGALGSENTDTGVETTEANGTGEQTATDGETTSTSDGELPGVSTEQMQSEIQQMLLTWHEDVVAGNYHSAWELLSQRKQQQDEREYGYATWVKNQSTLRPYLHPSGLSVTVEQTEPITGVAQVDVTGMGWDKPGAPCHEWSGITWVKYEDGSWKYDPGYSTTPQREREFKPRYSELLGGRC